MRRETDFVLEQAAWPAMVLEESGAIRRCNRAALALFGPAIQAPTANLASFWGGAGGDMQAFLGNSQNSAASIKLRLANAGSADFIAHLSRVSRDGQSFLLLQLFKESGGEFPELNIPAEARQPIAPRAEPSAPMPLRSAAIPEATVAPKDEPSFVLESAPWPALLVNRSGLILKANRAAVQAFGSNVGKSGASLAALWTSDNKLSAHEFIQRPPETPVPVQIRLKIGMPGDYSAQACANEEGLVLVQLFKAEASTQSPSLGQMPSLAALAVPSGAPAQGQTEITSVHKQKLECALQLARSVALDFNNALTSILGHTSLLLSRAEPVHPFRESLAEIEKSAVKAAEVASDLAAFTRQEKEARVQVSGNLNTLLERSMESFRGEHPSVTWSLHFERKLYTSNFDEAKMQQALSKVIENAIEAIKPSGRIGLQTQNLELTEATQDLNAKLNPGNYVVAEITDNGEGINPDVLPRVFEPFFTTKGRTHRGLGLAWVYGIVTNHGGAVAISSKVGSGTSVRVYLPANKKTVRSSNVSNDDLHGKETVLFVDDEELLLTMAQMVLSSYGYTVLTANSGQKALEIITAKKDQIDVMITDLVMPGMNGTELTQRVQAMSPQTRIVWASGYPRSSKDPQVDSLLSKPFTAQDLLRKVKETLAE